jgi:hypothetical protein
MPRMFRVMEMDTDGLPKTGSSRNQLGARPPGSTISDVEVADGYVVISETGMSVNRSVRSMPFRLVPARLTHLHPSAAGDNALRVWSMGSGPFEDGPVNEDLELVVSSNGAHGCLRPSRPMTLVEYQDALAATRTLWAVSEDAS